VQDKLPTRKGLRLKDYDYSSAGCYFITICTKDKKNSLGRVVGCDAHIAPPYVELSKYGLIVNKHINRINEIYNDFSVDKYVIMPNHIHMILEKDELLQAQGGGAMWASHPTGVSVSSIIRSLKTIVSKEIGHSIWQTSFHDHIIRDQKDYLRIWQYIDTNPLTWQNDHYHTT